MISSEAEQAVDESAGTNKTHDTAGERYASTSPTSSRRDSHFTAPIRVGGATRGSDADSNSVKLVQGMHPASTPRGRG